MWWAATIVASDELSGLKPLAYAAALKIVGLDDTAGARTF